MQKIIKEYRKAQFESDAEFDQLSDVFPFVQLQSEYRKDRELSVYEKKYLLATERGDLASVKYYLDESNNFEKFDKNAVDPLGRSALHIAIEYENIEMIETLLNNNVEIGEGILHAINEEFVEAVEMLLNYQDNGGHLVDPVIIEQNKKDGKLANDQAYNSFLASKSFTPDITPLMLASHKDNYEIIKILLDRGETIMEPHDVRCSCHECIISRSEDSLRYSKSRINAYRALASPSLISLSSKDPILTAFQLSWELKRLSRIENEFKIDYEKLSQQCQEYASALLAETRSSEELEIILNYDHENPPALFENEEEKSGLKRLKLAIKYKQKKFVAHPHCQQLLVRLWYDGISSYRRRNIFVKILVIFFISFLFPFLSLMYLIIPRTKIGRILRQPFIKFICHSASYITFLLLLILASLRIRSVLADSVEDNNKEKRGPPPTSIEWMIYVYVAGFIWSEIKQLYNEGLIEYLRDWWNLLDFITNTLYITTIVLRYTSYSIVQKEIKANDETYLYNREKWDPWDPTLISEGIFAIANIFSSLKVVYMFTVNSHLGPLRISLGRMVFDIMKFGVFIVIVVFSFACGLTQLYWYYAQMKENQCRIKQFESDEQKEECLLNVIYFSNYFESLQTVFWGLFGYVEKDRLQNLYSKHKFTMFIGLLMFGTYSTIMIIVLVNMLIAMMNNSYQTIVNQADEEWKFARSRLWLSYFEEGSTLPAPFNIIPSPKSFFYLFRWIYQKILCLRKTNRKQARWLSIRKVMKKISEREFKYQTVIKDVIKRYVMRKQQRDLNAGVTEDDLNEIKQDISGLRFELLEILKNNNFKMDISNQKHTGKRKRGKLNLEKAMSKNIFEENNKITNIFETLNYNTKNLIPNEFENNSQKLTKKSDELNSKDLQSNSNDLMKEVHETPSKTKRQVKLNDHEPNANSSPPTMYKIALRIKKLTEVKVKKNIGLETQKNNLSANQNQAETPEISKTNNSFMENKPVVLNDVFSNEENDELERNYITPLGLPDNTPIDQYVERVTEV